MIDENAKDRTKLSLTKAELIKHKDKTYKILKIRDMMEKHSSKSNLVVITLPIITKNSPASLFLAWLDVLSSEMPPFIYVRGKILLR